jgi:hypothetical protein
MGDLRLLSATLVCTRFDQERANEAVFLVGLHVFASAGARRRATKLA